MQVRIGKDAIDMDKVARQCYVYPMPPTLKTILKPEVQRIFDHFSACFNMRIVFFSLQGEMLRQCQNRPDSRYCLLLREHVFGEETCRRLDHGQCQEAAHTGHLRCYECHAGLVEATMPIHHDGQLLGFVAIGQLRSQAALPPAMASAWETTGLPLVALEAAYHELSLAAPGQIEAIIDLFSLMVQYIVSQHMIALGGNSALETIRAYIETHIAEEITVQDVARLIDRSASTVSHLFTRHLGKSFKQTLIEMKLTHAEAYMRDHPDGTVADAAASAGYTDPLYFSRLYRRHRERPPSHFLAAAQHGP